MSMLARSARRAFRVMAVTAASTILSTAPLPSTWMPRIRWSSRAATSLMINSPEPG